MKSKVEHVLPNVRPIDEWLADWRGAFARFVRPHVIESDEAGTSTLNKLRMDLGDGLRAYSVKEDAPGEFFTAFEALGNIHILQGQIAHANEWVVNAAFHIGRLSVRLVNHQVEPLVLMGMEMKKRQSERGKKKAKLTADEWIKVKAYISTKVKAKVSAVNGA